MNNARNMQMNDYTNYILFSITYYLELRHATSFTVTKFFYQIKMLMFYVVQTTNLTFFCIYIIIIA